MKKYLLKIIIILCGFIFCIFCIIYYFKYLSLTKFNVYPIQYVKAYLKETYEGEFTLIATDFYMIKNDSYYVWEFEFQDQNNLHFYEYYQVPYEGSDGLNIIYDKSDGALNIMDYYWQTRLEAALSDLNVSDFKEDYNKERGGGIASYLFNMEQFSDVYEIAEIIASIYDYTFEHVKDSSKRVIVCKIAYKGEFLCGIGYNDEILYFIDKNRNKLYDYIVDEIQSNYMLAQK